MAPDDTQAREQNHEPDDAESIDPDGPDAPPIDDDIAAAVVERFPDTIFHESHGQPVLHVGRGDWADVATFLRDEQRFTQCLDVCAVDHLVDAARDVPPGVAPERFEVVANFLSHPRNRRIRTICQVPVDDPVVPSIALLYPGVAFGERETYDLFGIRFDGHPDLTRILMPDDWVGHPLRKDDSPARVPVTFKEDPGPR